MAKVLIPAALLLVATTLEAGGDALVRLGLRAPALPLRIALMVAGATTLYGYGLALNLSPLDWGRLMGAYVAMFFVVGQVINLLVFGTAPTLPIAVGGALIVLGGVVVTAWQR